MLLDTTSHQKTYISISQSITPFFSLSTFTLLVFEDANLKLSSVFSNVHGKTCSAVIEAILSGRTDADYLSSLYTHCKLKCTQEEIRAAVEGRFTEHHKFMLEVIRENIDHLEEQIKALEKRVDELVAPIGDEIARIAEIPGMGETSAKELLAEIGVDMEVFPSEGHLASWAGVCPGNNESAGKKKLENEPWEQSHESDSHGMCMGCIQNQRYTSSSEISEISR